ncbi:MAG: hypothetical protein LBU89_03120 [Fibromonadaceae bacterium]|nr:hypothetical protein [Fibromonadaceae bacterium]
MRYLIFIAVFAALIGCKPEEYDSVVILGNGWDASLKIATDTTSVFKANDEIVIQLDNGNKFFKVSQVELRIYQGETDRILFKRSQPVSNKDAKAIVKGPDFKPLTAREILRTSTPGTYRIAFAAGDSIIAEKRMELVK